MANSNELVKVLIVDDHRVFSDALNAILEAEAGISVLAQIYDSREAKEKIAEYDPDVVLMDYNMPHLNGIELTRQLLCDMPELNVLFVSMYNEERLIESFKNVGAKGYLSKAASAVEVISVTRKVYSGEYYFPENTIANQSSDENHLNKLKLSDREMEIVQLMKAGLKTKEIAEKLHISYYTAQTHRNNIKLKTGMKREAEFIKFIYEM